MSNQLGDSRLPERFWQKIEATESGCWQWTGLIDRYGYAKSSRNARGHRVAFEALSGPIPEGLQLDHLCRNRACVNPAHLEPVTQAENARRSAAAVKTHCVNGHPYTPENTYLRPAGADGGRRDCRACIRERVRRYASKRRTA